MWAIYLTCLSLSFPICNRPPPLLRQLWGFSGAWPRWNFTSCSRQSNGLKVVHIRISRTCECVSLCGKRVSACVIKLRIWRLAWVIWGRRCNPRFPYEGKREAGDRTTVRERDMKTQAEVCLIPLLASKTEEEAKAKERSDLYKLGTWQGNRFSPGNFERNAALLTLGFSTERTNFGLLTSSLWDVLFLARNFVVIGYGSSRSLVYQVLSTQWESADVSHDDSCVTDADTEASGSPKPLGQGGQT